MKNVLIQQRLIDALLCEKKLTIMEEKDWRLFQMQMVSTICLYLTDDVVIHVLNEIFPTAIWTKLEEMYMAKSLTNALFFWKHFYQLRMSEGQHAEASQQLSEDPH